MERRSGFKTRTILCAPIINRKGETIGVTEAINKKEGVFDREDENLIKALSSQISVALENAQLYEGTVDMKNYLSSVQDSITNGIVALDHNGLIVTLNKAAEEFFRIETDDKIVLDGWCMKPPAFDSKKKYPVLFYVYGEFYPCRFIERARLTSSSSCPRRSSSATSSSAPSRRAAPTATGPKP